MPAPGALQAVMAPSRARTKPCIMLLEVFHAARGNVGKPRLAHELPDLPGLQYYRLVASSAKRRLRMAGLLPVQDSVERKRAAPGRAHLSASSGRHRGRPVSAEPQFQHVQPAVLRICGRVPTGVRRMRSGVTELAGVPVCNRPARRVNLVTF
jgi:hypothetical protein